jgi:hypothetical protein
MSIAVALLQGIAGGLLIVVFLVVVAGALLLATVFGRAGGGRPQDAEEMLKRTGGSLLPGRIFCAIGLGFAVTGMFFVEVGTDVVGMILGVMGYYLRARVFGVVVIVVSVITLFVGLLAGQDVIPGAYSEAVDGLRRSFEK